MSSHAATKIDQKEYLKKYLSGDKSKKKKKDKKRKRDGAAKVKIIDDDASAFPNDEIDEELLLGGEDAPQIVGEYVEERPSGSSAPKWKSITVKDEPADDDIKSEPKNENDLWGRKAADIKIKDEFSPARKTTKTTQKQTTADISPPRRKHKNKRDRNSSERNGRTARRRSNSHNSNQSPVRKRKHSPDKNRKRRKSRDESPPGRRPRSPDSDQSPPRHRQRSRSNDQTPPRRRRKSPDSDNSPSRRRELARKKRSHSRDRSPPRRRQQSADSDQSPPRRHNRKRQNNQSPPRRRNRSRESDQSPPRRRRKSPDSDQSPPRRCEQNKRSKRTPSPARRPRHNSSDQSPQRRRNSDQSPPRRRSPVRIKREKLSPASSPSHSAPKRSSDSPPPTHKPKPGKTLDGKKAGLQDAASLKAENETRRQQEERLFAEMSSSVSGRDAEVRVRSTGRKGRRARDAEAEDPEVRRRKEEHERKKKELYDRWGKGLKQIEDHRERLEEQAYEGSKPLARYSNDEDLERHLREQERADDPMLEYMRQKRKKNQEEQNVPTKPVYEGSYPENRFGIRPGYRWDGVDRSNGYEKRWFDVQNEQRAVQEEAYKYSVEDM